MNVFKTWTYPMSRFVLLGLVLVWSLPEVGWTQTFKVVQSAQQLYAEPTFSAKSLGSIPDGTEVQIIQQSGEWYKVEYQDQQGWVAQQAFVTAKKLDVSKLLKGKAVQESKTDEVALAGKGFTPEVEATYRQKHPNLKYDQVDQVEKFEVSPDQLQAFQREGGLQ